MYEIIYCWRLSVLHTCCHMILDQILKINISILEMREQKFGDKNVCYLRWYNNLWDAESIGDLLTSYPQIGFSSWHASKKQLEGPWNISSSLWSQTPKIRLFIFKKLSHTLSNRKERFKSNFPNFRLWSSDISMYFEDIKGGAMIGGGGLVET